MSVPNRYRDSLRSDIITAARLGKLAEVKAIVSENPRAVTERDDDNGFCALHYAAKLNDLEMATFLLNAGSSPYASDTLGRWPVQIACGTGDARLVEFFERATFPENNDPNVDPFDAEPKSDTVRHLKPRP